MAGRPPERSWSELLLGHREFVDRLARRLLHDEHLAQDVAQETWRIALQRRPRDVMALATWLRRIVQTLVLKLGREHRRRRLREQRAARSEAIASTCELVTGEELRRRVMDVLLRVPEPSRTAMTLRHLEALPPRQIAQRLGISVAAVKARLKRGAAELRRDLDAGGSRSWRAGLALLCGVSSGTATPARRARRSLPVGRRGQAPRLVGAAARWCREPVGATRAPRSPAC